MILFAAARPNVRTAREVARIQKGVPGARWSPADKLHITTAFFGEVSDEQAELLDAELAQIRMSSFEVALSGVGHFGKAEPHALYAGVTPAQPLALWHSKARNAARRVGVVMEKRNYLPHLTLAYLRGLTDPARIISYEQRLARFDTRLFLIDEIILFSSHRKVRGPNIYREEASYPLLG